MTMVNVADAKTHLSKLLDAAVAGEEVILARNNQPLVRLVPVVQPPERELGFVSLDTPDERFAALEGADLDAWS